MSLRKVLGKVFLLGMLEVGALAGVPIRPDQIEKLMNVMHRVQCVMRDDLRDGKDRLPKIP